MTSMFDDVLLKRFGFSVIAVSQCLQMLSKTPFIHLSVIDIVTIALSCGIVERSLQKLTPFRGKTEFLLCHKLFAILKKQQLRCLVGC